MHKDTRAVENPEKNTWTWKFFRWHHTFSALYWLSTHFQASVLPNWL